MIYKAPKSQKESGRIYDTIGPVVSCDTFGACFKSQLWWNGWRWTKI